MADFLKESLKAFMKESENGFLKEFGTNSSKRRNCILTRNLFQRFRDQYCHGKVRADNWNAPMLLLHYSNSFPILDEKNALKGV